MKDFTWKKLLEMDLQKDDLAIEIGITYTFDTALPQDWLNEFVKKTGLNYNSVRYSTFVMYTKPGLGKIVSAWNEVNKYLEVENA